jgi:hypothetical protein
MMLFCIRVMTIDGDWVGLHDEIPRHVQKENNRWLNRGAFKASLVRIWGMSYKIDHHHAFH